MAIFFYALCSSCFLRKENPLSLWMTINLFLTTTLAVVGWLAHSEKRKRTSLQDLLARLLEGGERREPRNKPPF
jgi:hypothetical protein